MFLFLTVCLGGASARAAGDGSSPPAIPQNTQPFRLTIGEFEPGGQSHFVALDAYLADGRERHDLHPPGEGCLLLSWLSDGARDFLPPWSGGMPSAAGTAGSADLSLSLESGPELPPLSFHSGWLPFGLQAAAGPPAALSPAADPSLGSGGTQNAGGSASLPHPAPEPLRQYTLSVQLGSLSLGTTLAAPDPTALAKRREADPVPTGFKVGYTIGSATLQAAYNFVDLDALAAGLPSDGSAESQAAGSPAGTSAASPGGQPLVLGPAAAGLPASGPYGSTGTADSSLGLARPARAAPVTPEASHGPGEVAPAGPSSAEFNLTLQLFDYASVQAGLIVAGKGEKLASEAGRAGASAGLNVDLPFQTRLSAQYRMMKGASTPWSWSTSVGVGYRMNSETVLQMGYKFIDFGSSGPQDKDLTLHLATAEMSISF